MSLQIKIARSLSLESSSGTKQHLREIDRGEEYHRLFNTGHETADDMVHVESMSLHLSSLIPRLLLLLLFLRVSWEIPKVSSYDLMFSCQFYSTLSHLSLTSLFDIYFSLISAGSHPQQTHHPKMNRSRQEHAVNWLLQRDGYRSRFEWRRFYHSDATPDHDWGFYLHSSSVCLATNQDNNNNKITKWMKPKLESNTYQR